MGKYLLLGLLLFLLPSCASYGNCSCAASRLGIFTDDSLAVTLVQPDSAAEVAGVQVGDQLLDLRPEKSEPDFSLEPVPFTDSDAIYELLEYKVPSLVSQPCCGGARIPLVLRIERNGEVVGLEINSALSSDAPATTQQHVSPLTSPIGTPTPLPTPIPTRTPVPSDWRFF